VWQVVKEAPLLIKRFFTHNDYRDFNTTALVVGMMAIAVIYILLPHDLVDEEKYGVVGVLDDVVIVGGIAIYVSLAIFKAVVRQANLR
jgi:uncharacterized membrane protein YkvA (DUF1232 family)